MKMCQAHWDKLREAIRTRGLDVLVPSDAEQAAKGLADGKPDPLTAAHNSIVANALDRVGLALMMPGADGAQRCPICYLQQLATSEQCDCGLPECTPEVRVATLEQWIEHAANDELERIRGTASA